MNKLIEELDKYVNQQENLIKRLQDENKKLKSDSYKDSELAELKEKYEKLLNDSYRGFAISEDESNSINKWKEEHVNKKHKGKSFGAIGGNFIYEFTPTGIGDIGEIVCSCCGERFCFREL